MRKTSVRNIDWYQSMKFSLGFIDVYAIASRKDLQKKYLVQSILYMKN